ncbi:hypothetical protein IMG5_105460 [Ichthyophthirius multifiliis]|uniref:Uncharacterized protein n=1 Tax=Ichthyophthirius multifiliis TaxID=5932 RepID=G0QT17_ICHMU|nr:hypothetical protein IMG5_105460 [Ichthyophthirius multifiliis]EGR31634.1 hypothetical protein IMG5_105460 [Ichthyophthirius multifiliis]|eukprot:XP_004035120.1 hypothetical protein IMG5_105460 [Ichthyophthirius multifiliis]
MTNNQNRNILHRACIKQNHKLINKLLDDFQEILRNTQIKLINNKQISLNSYINEQDRFQNTPLLMTCLYNYSNSLTERHLCIQILIQHGAKVNQRNKRTLWSALHWCAYYGDPLSVQLLIENGAFSCFPDWIGQFPIDLAALSVQNSSKVVEIITKEVIQKIQKVEGYIQSQKNNLLDLEFPLSDCFLENQEDYLLQNQRKYLLSPILKYRIIFWSAFFKLELNLIKKACSFSRSFIVVKMQNNQQMNSLHATVVGHLDNQNIEILDYFISLLMNQLKIKKTKNFQYANQQKRKFSYQNNDVLFLFKQEQKFYKKQFLDEIRQFDKWEQLMNSPQFNSIQDFLNLQKNNIYIFFFYFLFFRQDLYGNTPLHLSFINGNMKAVELLLTNGAFIEKENKEGWQARELIQFNEIDIEYEKKLIEIENRNNKRFQTMEYNLNKAFQKIKATKIGETSNILNSQLYNFGNQIYVPDYVIVFNTEAQNTSENPNQQEALINRINFQINLLKNSDFQVYLMESLYPNKLYVMLCMEQDKLRKACQENKMLMKKIDSYDYEVYNIDQKHKFEPFRSKQRQEIIEQSLQKIINLQDLKNQKLVYCYYKMHKYGGMAKIKDKWIENTKWYFPQPLNQMDDYLLEGKGQNFNSVTLLRQYFGEKIAFFLVGKVLQHAFWFFQQFQVQEYKFMALQQINLTIYLFHFGYSS